jgi:hypothetical protein
MNFMVAGPAAAIAALWVLLDTLGMHSGRAAALPQSAIRATKRKGPEETLRGLRRLQKP